MDSINQQQQEENHLDLDGGEAGQKIKTLCEKTKTCFFCTGARPGSAMESRPMSVQKVDEDGTLWFLSASDSKKNAEIATDPAVQLFFQGSAYADFLTLHGRAIISRDKQKIQELWEPIMKTWFTGGVDDQRITVLEVRPDHGYYWDTKHGKLVAFAKQIAGAIMGKTMDDSIEGRLQVR